VRLSLARLDGAPPPGWNNALPREASGAPAVQTGAMELSENPVAGWRSASWPG